MDREHLRLIQISFDAIREWHRRNPGDSLDLSGADLSRADMSDAPLGSVDLTLADLSWANLNRAELSEADFTRANMTDAKLAGANLSRANLQRADLHGAILRHANLGGASFSRSDLSEADLSGANLEGAELFETNLSNAIMTGANLTNARCGGTIFSSVDLSEVTGLETVEHIAASTLGLDTIQRSRGKISEKFLRGCGVPESRIASLRGPRKPGHSIGQWVLLQRLGRGGSGDVWEAKDDKGTVAAVKILRNPKGQAYVRFRSEVHFHRSHGFRPGVLPLLDASLPDLPSHDHPAWLAMPVAANVEEGLAAGDGSLDRVVEAVTAIADTLAQLHALQISHRDIKPANLFWHEGAWLIGDFGLVDYPQKTAITKPGNKLGPMYFLAPEMITRANKADGRAADVYSLAKTLWVLATGQTYPPKGEQRMGVRTMGIADWVSDERAPLLDRLIDRATRENSDERPSMHQFASELQQWLRRVKPRTRRS
jgi:hypothetical protein